MTTSRPFHPKPGPRWGLLLLLVLWLPIGRAFTFLEVGLGPGNALRIQHPTDTNFYQVLVEGPGPNGPFEPVTILGPTNGPAIFQQPLLPGDAARFFRVQRHPVQLPADQDRDGIDDLFELRHSAALNPLNPADARLDPDGDGLTNLEESWRRSDPTRAAPATVLTTSPRDGETGVAVTRETVVRLTQPLAPGTQLTAAHLVATAAGRPLLSRPDLSADRRTVTLFYLEPLPANEAVTVELRGTGLPAGAGVDLDADGDGQPGGTNRVVFRTLGIQPSPNTAISGTVYESDRVGGTNRPLAGVTITVDGAEESLRAVTDAEGRFTLDPCPAGRFFVHVDGRTAALSQWPDGDYYPFIGKAWTAVAGARDNLATPDGAIYLPRVRRGTLQTVSANTSTAIQFPASVVATNPALAGVAVTVPPNALFAENGQRGGRVGIAPVPADRLPEPLPGGLTFPLVITVQTDGPGNFDQPVPVQFPNLPDPATGQSLPAGAKSALWSFNHDTGHWEFQGTMTVSADARLVVSDPGVGILQPGWHGTSPGSPPVPPPGPPPQAPDDDTPCAGEAPYPEIWDVVVEATKCVANLLRAGQVVQGSIEVVNGISQMAQAAYALYQVGELMKTGQLDDFDEYLLMAQPILKSLLGQKEIVKGILDLVNTANPASEVASAINCVLALTRTGAALDCALDCRKGDPDCLALDALLRDIELAAAVGKAVAEGEIALEPICVGLDFLASLLPTPSRTPPAPSRNGRPAAPAPDLNEIVAAIDSVRAEADILTTKASNLLAFVNLAEATLPPALQRLGDSIARRGLYIGALVQVHGSDGSDFRARVGADGVLPLPVLRPGLRYTLSLYQPGYRLNAWSDFVAPLAGTPFAIPTPRPFTVPGADENLDADRDGLPDYAETIAGTDARLADTDDDGVADLVEINQGTNPLFRENASLRPVAALDTPGMANDVTVLGQLALVADGTAGLSIISVSNVVAPVLVARLDTPGSAHAVAAEGTFAAVADQAAGLAIIDLSQPTAPILRRQVELPGFAQGVAVRDGFAYVALGGNGLAVVDLPTGEVLRILNPGDDVDGVEVSGGRLYVLGRSRLEIRELILGGLRKLGEFNYPQSWGRIPGRTPPRSLSVSGQHAYVGYFTGYSVLDVANPASPVVVGSPPTPQSAVHDLWRATNDRLLTLTSFAGPESLALTTYQAANPADTTAFLATRSVGGEPRAVAEYRGHALIANGPAGLQVVAFCLPEVDDEVLVSFTFRAPATVNSRQRQLLEIDFGPRRRVLQADLLVDGSPVSVSRSWPFTLPWTTPDTATNRVVQLTARVTGFSGLVSTSAPVAVTVQPAASIPSVISQVPGAGSSMAVVHDISLLLDQPLDPAGLEPGGIQLRHLGSDGLAGTADDTLLAPSGLRLLAGGRWLRIDGFGVLPEGTFELSVAPGVLRPASGGPAFGSFSTRFQRTAPAATIQWASDQDGSWHNPANWNPARVPLPTDHVLIDRPLANPTITLTAQSGPIVVTSLRSRERLMVEGADLTVAGLFQSELTGEVVLGGTPVFRANQGALLVVSGLSQGAASLVAGIGGNFELNPSDGVIELPEFRGTTSGTTGFDARPGSRISAPRFTGGSGSTLSVQAVGGEVHLNGMGPDVSQRFSLRASAGGQIRLPGVRTLDGVDSRNSLVSVQTPGRIEFPNITFALNQKVFVTGTEANWSAPGLQEFRHGELEFSGGQRSLALRSTSNLVFRARGGARVDLPQLTEVGGTGNGPGFTASEAAILNLAALARINGPVSGIFPASLAFRALSGGQLNLPALEQSPAGRILLGAEGPNSVLRLPALRQLDGPASGTSGTLEALDGGQVDAPILARIQGTLATLRGTGRLLLGSNTVTFNDAELVLAPTASLSAGPLTLEAGAILRGSGSLPASLVNGGIVRPGGGSSLGTITVNGSYQQLAAGRLELDLAGTSPGQADLLAVSGPATLGGTLALTRLSGLSYASGQRFAVLRYASASGALATLSGNSQGGVTLQAAAGPTVLELVAP